MDWHCLTCMRDSDSVRRDGGSTANSGGMGQHPSHPRTIIMSSTAHKVWQERCQRQQHRMQLNTLRKTDTWLTW